MRIPYIQQLEVVEFDRYIHLLRHERSINYYKPKRKKEKVIKEAKVQGEKKERKKKATAIDNLTQLNQLGLFNNLDEATKQQLANLLQSK